MRIRVQNDALEAARRHARSSAVQSTEKEILMRSLLNLRDSLLSLFF